MSADSLGVGSLGSTEGTPPQPSVGQRMRFKNGAYSNPLDGLTVTVRGYEGSLIRVADVDGEWPEFYAWPRELTPLPDTPIDSPSCAVDPTPSLENANDRVAGDATP